MGLMYGRNVRSIELRAEDKLEMCTLLLKQFNSVCTTPLPNKQVTDPESFFSVESRTTKMVYRHLYIYNRHLYIYNVQIVYIIFKTSHLEKYIIYTYYKNRILLSNLKYTNNELPIYKHYIHVYMIPIHVHCAILIHAMMNIIMQKTIYKTLLLHKTKFIEI